MNETSPFVDTQFVFDNLNKPDVAIVDASWHMPNSDQTGLGNFISAHIPGAVYFDLDKIADTSSDLPHMVASPEVFSKMVGDLGISENDQIIVYDSSGLFSAARVWWNFKTMGARNCFVLRGGLPKWKHENRPLSAGAPDPAPKQFSATTKNINVVSKSELEEIVKSRYDETDVQIVDVRSKARFNAQAPEPRPGIRSGRIPGSKNLPFMNLVKDGELIEVKAIKEQLANAGIDLKKPIIASCGSGVTAPILCLALAEIGVDAMRVYDGSWSEWGMPGPHPVLGANNEFV